MDAKELASIQWRMPEWVMYNGGYLTQYNVLDYFAQSPFYDNRSNNQVLKMQSQFSQLGDLTPQLVQMTGLEYMIAEESLKQPMHPNGASVNGVWVIRKQTRSSPDQVQPESTYFIAGDNVYMAPSVQAILSSRLENLSVNLVRSIESIQSIYRFQPGHGYSYTVASERQDEGKHGTTQPPAHEELGAAEADVLMRRALGKSIASMQSSR